MDRTAITVTGLDSILRKMEYLNAKGADKVLCAMLRAQLNAIGKQMKADLSPKVKDGRRGVKARFKRKIGKWVNAKVGFGVGKKRPKEKLKTRSRGRGVGIGPNNVHWWIAGTRPRYTGVSYKKKSLTGSTIHATGAMPAMQPGLAMKAAMKSRSKQSVMMQKKGNEQLAKQIKVMQNIR